MHQMKHGSTNMASGISVITKNDDIYEFSFSPI